MTIKTISLGAQVLRGSISTATAPVFAVGITRTGESMSKKNHAAFEFRANEYVVYPALGVGKIVTILPTPCAGYTTNSFARNSKAAWFFLDILSPVRVVPAAKTGTFAVEIEPLSTCAPSDIVFYRHKTRTAKCQSPGGSSCLCCICVTDSGTNFHSPATSGRLNQLLMDKLPIN